jgi:hypothetical protein
MTKTVVSPFQRIFKGNTVLLILEVTTKIMDKLKKMNYRKRRFHDSEGMVDYGENYDPMNQ